MPPHAERVGSDPPVSPARDSLWCTGISSDFNLKYGATACPSNVNPVTVDGPPAPFQRFLAFLRAHPILCLALLTPGIPEYLSTSSSILNLGLNPVWFFLQLAINVGQYTAGALLIREAVLRWHKGWGTVFLLGLAYGITEEGLGDNTLFNSNHGADGFLGSFGRFAGVNWVWSTGVLTFHVIYSIGLPILLLGLALPETRGKSLIGRRGIVCALLSLVASTAIETVIVWRAFDFWMGSPLLVGSLLAIAFLALAAYLVPSDIWRPAKEHPVLSTRAVGTVGFLVFPVIFLLEYLVPFAGVPAVVVITLEVFFLAVVLEILRRGVGRTRNEDLLVNLSVGFLLWQCAFGLLIHIPIFYNVPLVILAVWFCVRLRRRYPASPPSPPAGALGESSSLSQNHHRT